MRKWGIDRPAPRGDIPPMPNPLTLLKRGVKRAGSQTAYARELDLSLAYLNDLLHGRRKVSAKVAKRLGLIRETRYRQEAK